MVDDSTKSPRKRRWLQFRLRTLLILVILLCLGLGGWQIYATHFASYIVAEPVRVGEPIRVRGRLLDFRGASTTAFVVYATQPHSRAPHGYVICQSGSGRLKKAGRWTSEFEIDLRNNLKAGAYRLQFHPVNHPPVFGKLVVLPSEESGDE